MGTKGNEMNIWNQMVCEDKKPKSTDAGEPPAYIESIDAEKDTGYWKYDVEKNESGNDGKRKKTRFVKFFHFFLALSLLLFGYHKGLFFGNFSCNHHQLDVHPDVETSFEITIKQLPLHDPVHTEHLLSYSFGDSWGHPAQASFKPYTGSPYNKIILELSTNITGIQHDRLGHIFINNVTVWRTSTVEPYDEATIVSESSKDITQYISLFQDSDDPLELIFQLDNIVTNKQTGVFNVELKLHYYYEHTAKHGTDETATDFFYHYAAAPPSRVLPLVGDKKRRTPLLYYPISSHSNPRWRRSLEDFAAHEDDLEHAILEVFISGNAAEEFWYGNVLDKYVSKFKNGLREVMGHGPLRALKVFLYDGEHDYLVSTVIPTPVIYTGGFSPALWRPCVGIDAFDLESLFVDLTPFIPLLKDGKPWELQMEIVSSLDDKYKSTIGENWIISGNIKQWTNPASSINHKELKSNIFDSTFDINVVDRNPSHLHQAVNATTKNEVASLLYLEDKPYVLSHTYHNEFVSNLTFYDDGNDEHTVVNLEKYNIISLYENASYGVADPIISLVDKASWNLVGSVRMLDIDVSKSELSYKATVGRTVDRLKYIKDYTSGEEFVIDNSEDIFNYLRKHDSTPHMVINALQGSQIGSSEFTLSPSGNHGSGDSVHNVRVVSEFPIKEHYKRDVIVSDNSVVFDVVKRDL
ncbi:uncharacterized protein KLLA0_E15291g [Kluyveromyces lactis]|uniref:KLLA0E15291p n=1 Tax=Kluyveromyces lactis (strain ATCC 8585 / CBS 2359 / DSM 70799 / NBRC 1267 / NRRL Y-1140 / WM37) TaxID=284590 RepID=Q6CN50_KLULA|nr:uncharacterized protein KLLA0_E15291g [Kluyveromyces lactis]CAG99726.1 KLLA0E15291p [Kluyveromyces lactis]|eukprot:XP_454639.1 uncharacterized protein KLLA0_E15291g [Kluyveromyces lactis]